jgi:trans-2-enoyl-CoA reductase
MSDNEFKHLDKLAFSLAAAVDSQLRAFNVVMEPLNDLEVDYVKTKLKSEKDPLLATVFAQLAGMREFELPEQQESN